MLNLLEPEDVPPLKKLIAAARYLVVHSQVTSNERGEVIARCPGDVLYALEDAIDEATKVIVEDIMRKAG